jgi:Flp pilus assembly protein TadG
MKSIVERVRQFRARRQRGSIMVLTAVMISALLGIMALSVDLGFVLSMRTQYQNGIDAAALAAGAALRTTIEADAGAPQRLQLVQAQARQFAGLNEVRRNPDTAPVPGAPPQPNANAIDLPAGAISILENGDLPRVVVDAQIPVPTLFAGIAGFYSMQVRGRAEASIFPVDGGIGSMSAGTARGGGCWRPIMLPDTFYDSSGVPHYLYEDVGGGIFRVPNPADGDYYRSRFAAGARNADPFVSGAGTAVTGLRDTQLATEIGTKTIMGKQVTFRSDSYFVTDFSGLPRTTYDALGVMEWASIGYCGQVRVGDELPVYPRGDLLKIEQVRAGLIALKNRTIDYDPPFPMEEMTFHYVASNEFPGPNTHGAIIPVLFYNPFKFNDSPARLRVTNIGLFLINNVDANGSLSGYFVREIIGGGTPIAAANFQGDSGESFKKTWLPMSVQLLK